MRLIRFAALSALAATLANCGPNTAVVGPPFYRPSYEPGEHTYQSVIPVVVRGNPFPAPDADVGLAVARAMQGNTYYPARFEPATVDPRASYRVVVLFAPPGNYPYPDMCTAAVLPSGAPLKGRVPVSAALCKWDILLAATSGWVDAPAPDSPFFAAGMGSFTRALFPPYTGEFLRGDGGFRR